MRRVVSLCSQRIALSDCIGAKSHKDKNVLKNDDICRFVYIHRSNQNDHKAFSVLKPFFFQIKANNRGTLERLHKMDSVYMTCSTATMLASSPKQYTAA